MRKETNYDTEGLDRRSDKDSQNNDKKKMSTVGMVYI
jgi:hypothetical protein